MLVLAGTPTPLSQAYPSTNIFIACFLIWALSVEMSDCTDGDKSAVCVVCVVVAVCGLVVCRVVVCAVVVVVVVVGCDVVGCDVVGCVVVLVMLELMVLFELTVLVSLSVLRGASSSASKLSEYTLSVHTLSPYILPLLILSTEGAHTYRLSYCSPIVRTVLPVACLVFLVGVV